MGCWLVLLTVTLTTLMLLLPNPTRLMLGYLCGALLTSITLGLVIVFSFSSSTVSTAQHQVSPWIDIALGVLALALAFALFTVGAAKTLAQQRNFTGSISESIRMNRLKALGDSGFNGAPIFCLNISRHLSLQPFAVRRPICGGSLRRAEANG